MTIDNDNIIAIDRGGTFTDIYYRVGNEEATFKILSEDPSNYDDANIEGIRRVLEKVTGKRIPRSSPLDTSLISSIRLGTTVAVNALLQRKGSRCALVTTKGFRDFLHIGDQSRPDLFALNIEKPGVLYDEVIEIDERVTLPSFSADPTGFTAQELLDNKTFFHGRTGEVFEVIKPIAEEELKAKLSSLKKKGIDSIAVVFIHGYNFQSHEKTAGRIAKDLGFQNISLSHEILPVIKALSRGHSTVLDAYLTPIVKNYISNFLKGFAKDYDKHTRIEFMQSDGGLCSWNNFTGLKSLLSGPAGGVVGAAKTCFDSSYNIPVIGFDMGGTSTDISRYAGELEISLESVTAGIKLASPQININTVAAGGGSILSYRNGSFVVGPESASSHPGPACYKKGGPLTITDANLFTGRLLVDFFPKIFGPSEDEPLDIEATKKRFEELTKRINADNPKFPKTPQEVALGFLEVANFQMAKPIRNLTDSKGHDVSKHILASFGGAGGQHAASLAKILKMKKVIIHKHSSILSAYGISMADVIVDKCEPCAEVYSEDKRRALLEKCYILCEDAEMQLKNQGVSSESIEYKLYFQMGYKDSDTRISVMQPEDNDFLKLFYEIHQKEFAFCDLKREVVVSDIRIRALGNTFRQDGERSAYSDYDKISKLNVGKGCEITVTPVCFDEGTYDSNVYELEKLPIGSRIRGPAILLDPTQTLLVTPDATATVLPRHVILELTSKNNTEVTTKYVDPIQVSIFANRFMAIADDMSRTLQKISVSANIKERLDYSCALFDSEGNLTANAPNVPVHLGSMSSAIKNQIELWKDDLNEGDILCTNSPSVGGTHLPDITVVTPFFVNSQIKFVVASRAHHSEIGGSAPGSSSSYAKDIFDEGVNISTWKIVSKGRFDYEGLIKHFIEVPISHGVSGTRNMDDNVVDLKAQIASNQRGIKLLQELFLEYGGETVLFYLRNVRKAAEIAVRDFLQKYYAENKSRLPLVASDYMDDGSEICVNIKINGDEGSAVIDFTGTSLESFSNLNAPKSITFSAVIYVLRCLVNLDFPLNQGCLSPCTIIIPENSLINPSPYAAVSAGNGMTSQRITDVLFKAFGIVSASGGCMNGINFGTGDYSDQSGLTKGFGYTETIGQGSCAGILEKEGVRKGFHGFSGTQTNMTNTRITDPEVLEYRYPCLLKEYTIRQDSGGKGKWNGGNGLVREIQFTFPVHVSLVTQRRVMYPWGIFGGEPGKRGENYLGRSRGDGEIQWIRLPSLAEIEIRRYDILKILTPGGGGFGRPTDTDEYWGVGDLSTNVDPNKYAKRKHF